MKPNCVYGAICTSALVPVRGAPWAEELARALGGKQWSACCPAHDDKSPSLIIFAGRRCAVPRIDLDGNVCGEVTAAEAQHADARLAAILAARARKQELIKLRAAAKPAAPRKKEKPPEEKPSAPRRDGLAALRGAARQRRGAA